jgi:hypothetical protein
MNPAPEAAPIRRRLVYYLSGFDPRGVRFYHQLFRSEAQRQAALHGGELRVSRRSADGAHASCWTISSSHDSGTTETRYVFLSWDDLIRAHWPTSRARVLGDLLDFYWQVARNGVLAKTRACARRTFWMMLAPLIYAGLAIGVAGALAFAALYLLELLSIAPLPAGLAAASIAGLLLWGALAWAESLRLYWLSRIIVFMVRWGRLRPPALEQRWDDFAAKIDAELALNPADEVLLVGHSVGAAAAIAVADRWLARQPPGALEAPSLKLLTLGQVIPLLGMVPQADWYRAELQRVAASPLLWLDYTAPADGLCYALVDPVVGCGLPPRPPGRLRVKSARFDLMFTPAAFRALRKDPFRLHFQYLMATDLPVANDYFRLTSGISALPVGEAATA